MAVGNKKGFAKPGAQQPQATQDIPASAARQIDQGKQVSSSIHGLVLNNAIAKVEQIEAHVDGIETQMAHRIAAAVNPDLVEARTWGKVGNLLVEYGRNAVDTGFWAQPAELPLVRSVAMPSLQALYEPRNSNTQGNNNQQSLPSSQKTEDQDGNQNNK